MSCEEAEELKNLIVKIVDEEGYLDTDKLDRGILELRNTPNDAGNLLSHMVFGQETRSIFPSIYNKLLKERRKNYYNVHVNNLKDLKSNDKVRIQNGETSG